MPPRERGQSPISRRGSDGRAADRLAGPRPARDAQGRFVAPHPTAGSMAVTAEIDRLLGSESTRAALARSMAETTAVLSAFVESEHSQQGQPQPGQASSAHTASNEEIARDVVAYNRGYQRAIQDVLDLLAAGTNEPLVVRDVSVQGREGLLADDDRLRGCRLGHPGRRVVWTRIQSPARGVYTWIDDDGRTVTTASPTPPRDARYRGAAVSMTWTDDGVFSWPEAESVPDAAPGAVDGPPSDLVVGFDDSTQLYTVSRYGVRLGAVTLHLLRSRAPYGTPEHEIPRRVVEIWWSRHRGDFSPFAPRETDPGGLNGALAPAAPRRRRVLDMSGAVVGDGVGDDLVPEDGDGDAAGDPEHADPVSDTVE